MLSKSCIHLVHLVLDSLKPVEVESVFLGEVTLKYDIQTSSMDQIQAVLKQYGFIVLKDKNEQLVEEIKLALVELIHFAYNTNSLIRNSDYLSEKLGVTYQQLSKVFSEMTGMTIEKYLILLKIEKVKELVSYGEMTLSEISYMMGYSSVNYLSNQFKKVAGVTVSQFKKNSKDYRFPLEELL